MCTFSLTQLTQFQLTFEAQFREYSLNRMNQILPKKKKKKTSACCLVKKSWYTLDFGADFAFCLQQWNNLFKKMQNYS